MIKRFAAVCLSTCLVLGLSGCGSDKDDSAEKELTGNYKQTMLVVPESINTEKGFLDEYESVEKVVLPDNYEKDIDKITDQIASFAENKKVKCIIIASDEEGMLPVFEKIREKNDTVITVAAGIEEARSEENIETVATDQNITMGFNPTGMDNPLNAVRMAKAMGASSFVNYVDTYSKDNLYIMEDSKYIKSECRRNNIKYIEVEVRGMKNENDYKGAEKFIMEDAEKRAGNKNTALYASTKLMDEAIIRAAIDNKLMVPNIHSLNSGELYCKILDIDVKEDEKDDYRAINDKISKEVNKIGMEGKLAGNEIPEKTFCIEAAIETTEQIFTKNGDEFSVFKEMQSNVKEKTGIWAEYKKVKYDRNFFRAVELYPILY